METDFDKIEEKLKEIGAECMYYGGVDAVETDDFIPVHLFKVHDKGLIVLQYKGGQIGLYTLVGENGAPVESDLAFIEELAKSQIAKKNAELFKSFSNSKESDAVGINERFA